MKPEILTFDCYGTLIDWKKGIIDILQSYPDVDQDAFFEIWWRVDRRLTCDEPYRRYRDILACNFTEAFNSVGITISTQEAKQFADDLGNWSPFSDAPEALCAFQQRGFKLGILSNIDNDLLTRSTDRIGISFDLLITAETLHSYKPAPAHFETLLTTTGFPPSRVLHIAASRFVDIAPASEHGLKTLYVCRSEPDTNYNTTPDFTVNTLSDAISILDGFT